MRSSMWSTIPTPWRAPTSAAAFEQLDELRAARRRARPGRPRSNSTVDRLGLVGRLLGAGDELEDVVLGRVVEVLDPAALRGAPPEVVVDRVGRRLGAALDRDPVLARVGDLLLAAHLPGAHRRDHLQLRRERRDVASIRTWSLPLPVQPWAIVSQPLRARVLDGELGDQRPARAR